MSAIFRRSLAHPYACIHSIYLYIRYSHTYIHTCMHACMHAYIHTYIHTCIHTYIRAYVHTYISISISIYVSRYVICIYIYTYYILHISFSLHIDTGPHIRRRLCCLKLRRLLVPRLRVWMAAGSVVLGLPRPLRFYASCPFVRPSSSSFSNSILLVTRT